MSFLRSAFLLAALLAVVAVAGGVIFPGVVPSHAVQNPTISLDMLPSGNTYDEATNTMTVGASENCLTSATANPATHTHVAQLVIRDVEDLVGWQVRMNYVGDRMRPQTVNFNPFTDNTTGQSVSFINLPIDSSLAVHRDVTTAGSIPPAPPDGSDTPQTALIGATYNGTQGSEVSADTPLKSPPDGGAYDAPNGGVLGSVLLQVIGNESGQASLFMNLDDNNPNPPGSSTVIFTGTGIATVNLAASALGDGFHGEGTNCVPLDCVDVNCPVMIDTTNHTFTNDTPLPASGLHIRFDQAVTPRLVQNAPGCPPPVMSGDNAAGRVDLDWSTLCADSGETVVIEIKSWPKAGVTCSDWSILGVAALKDCDAH